MKQMKKILGMIMAMLLIIVMPSAVRAETGYTITAPDNGHTYEVYQIFTGRLDAVNTELINLKWGKNGTGAEGTAVDAAILTELEQTSGSSDIEKLKLVKKYVTIKADQAYGTVGEGSAQPMTNVPAGYYLIKDVDGSQTGENSAYTTYVVKIVGNIAIQPKMDVPVAEKYVKDINDSQNEENEWQKTADYDIGDEIPFQMTAKIPSNYEDYESYKIVFHDTQAEGLSFKKDTVKVMVDGKDITENSIVKPNPEGTETFQIIIEGLKKLSFVKAGSTITVEYKSVLNNNAIHGAEGNSNSMYLEYSNNPNGEGTGRTPKREVKVFTYKVVIHKVKPGTGGNQTEPLVGAGFTLEKRSSGEGDSWKAISGVKDEQGTTFTFSGLDAGEYRLKETKTPEGYNSIEPVNFQIAAEHGVDGELKKLSSTATDITFTENVSEGSLTADILNQKGTTLPQTGGRGTFLIYMAGVVLVLGAGAALVIKKRRNK